jgi:hypothetical protein
VVTLTRMPSASPITAPTTTKNHVPLAPFLAPIPMPTILAAQALAFKDAGLRRLHRTGPGTQGFHLALWPSAATIHPETSH